MESASWEANHGVAGFYRSEAVGAEYEPEPMFAKSRAASVAVALALTIGAVTAGLCLADWFLR